MGEAAPIRSESLTIEGLFEGRKFGLASYQREYTWSRSEVRALVLDLHRRFRSQWRDNHDHTNVETYDPYFLGSIVHYEENNVTYLVDGQQRVTTLHLLLIFLHRLLEEQKLDTYASKVLNLIWSTRRRAFTVHIDERTDVLRAIMDGRPAVVPPDAPPSLVNLVARYAELAEDFPHDLRYDALEYFVHWLLWRVCVVAIEAENRTRGWEIFETTNDRGIRLGPMDLLKSHLIGQATRARQRELHERWRTLMSRLAGIDAQAPSDFMKELVVAHHLDDIGDASRAAATAALHEWIRDHAAALGLDKRADYERFVNRVLRLGDWYAGLRSAASAYHPDQSWAVVTYVNQHNDIPHHLTAVLAALRPDDDQATFQAKAHLVGGYLDLLYARRLVNRPAMPVSRLSRTVLDLVLKLRGCADVDAVRSLLGAELAGLKDGFGRVRRFGLSPETRGKVRYLLARTTAFVQIGVGAPDQLASYLDPAAGWDIEHIVPDHYADFPQPADATLDAKEFAVLRNRLGALLLLPKAQNSAIGDAPYRERIEHYRGQHLLAAALHPRTRERNPTLRRFLHDNGLDKLLQPVPDRFGAEAIELRQRLYERLCELVWDPARLGLVVPPDERPAAPSTEDGVAGGRTGAGAAPARRVASTPNTQVLRQMVATGVLRPDDDLLLVSDGQHYHARVLSDGCVQVLDELFPDLTAAGNFVRGKATRGWEAWKVHRDGRWVPTGSLRRAPRPATTPR
jgi:hypothetical protein